MKFKIDRKVWRCGYGRYDSLGRGQVRLLNREGYMCCLGQCLQQSGLEKHYLLDKHFPSNLNVFVEYFTNDNCSDSELSREAYIINDDERINQTEREEKLQKLFEKYGHELEFINQYRENNDTRGYILPLGLYTPPSIEHQKHLRG